jgi:hypothetical protein
VTIVSGRHSYERWIFACDIRMDGDVPASQTAKRVLKRLWRDFGVRCRGFSEDEELMTLREENSRLRRTISDMKEESPT